MTVYTEARWGGEGVYVLIISGSTPPPNPVPFGRWIRVAANWDEVQRYNTLASYGQHPTCYARAESDLSVSDDPIDIPSVLEID